MKSTIFFLNKILREGHRELCLKMIPKLKPECIPLSLPLFGLQVLVQGGKRRGVVVVGGFHGLEKLRVSVVKPNIRDSVPNTEPAMRVCRPG